VIDGQFDTQGWNRFSYVVNNPIKYKDPTGHERFPTTSRTASEVIAGNIDESQYMNKSQNEAPTHGEVKNPLKGHYGWVRNRGSKKHGGIDIKGEKGDPVLAYTEGEVVFAGYHEKAGNYITVKHEKERYDKESGKTINETFFTRYLHLDKINVRKGEKVKEGQKIGAIGSTGNAEKYDPHLHFEVRKLKGNVDPEKAKIENYRNKYTKTVEPVEHLEKNQTVFQKMKEIVDNVISNF